MWYQDTERRPSRSKEAGLVSTAPTAPRSALCRNIQSMKTEFESDKTTTSACRASPSALSALAACSCTRSLRKIRECPSLERVDPDSNCAASLAHVLKDIIPSRAFLAQQAEEMVHKISPNGVLLPQLPNLLVRQPASTWQRHGPHPGVRIPVD